MLTSSAKAKGRNLQKKVRDSILQLYPQLTTDDVRSTSMGASGEDVQLSSKARELFPYSVECKAYAKLTIDTLFKQAEANAGKHQPLLVVKANNRDPLVVLRLSHFMELLKNE